MGVCMCSSVPLDVSSTALLVFVAAAPACLVALAASCCLSARLPPRKQPEKISAGARWLLWQAPLARLARSRTREHADQNPFESEQVREPLTKIVSQTGRRGSFTRVLSKLRAGSNFRTDAPPSP